MTKFAFSDPSGTLENKELRRGMPSAQVQSQPEPALQKNNRRGLYFSLNTQNSSHAWQMGRLQQNKSEKKIN